MSASGMYTAHITSIIQEAPGIRRLVMKVNGDEQFIYRPGHYVLFDLPLETKVKTRSYSIASNMNNENVLEFVIQKKDGGAASEYLFHRINEGTVISFKGPYGKAFVPDTFDHEVCFICTDVGIGPVRPAVKQLLSDGFKNDIRLLFGNRYEQDILFRNELEQLEQEHGNFSFIPVLSREEGWQGEKGYVHALYEKLYSGNNNLLFYISGWSRMVNEARQRLGAMGYVREQITFQLYT